MARSYDRSADDFDRSVDDESIQETAAVTVITRPRKPKASRQACLVMIHGGELGKKYTLEASTLIIGRSSKSDIHLDEESVSRSHCKLVANGAEIVVRDLGSTNGTLINDSAVAECALRDGDMLKVGRAIFKFLTGDNIEHAYHEEIYRLTTVDGLTQVHNKRYFVDVLDREISRGQRYGRDLSVIMFDVDNFKTINDEFGHLAGDFVLRHLASVVKKRVRREDIIARYGGDEFVIVLPEIDGAHARALADKIHELVGRTEFMFDNRRVDVAISIGVATATPDTNGPEDFVKLADANLYEAKRRGRNRVWGPT